MNFSLVMRLSLVSAGEKEPARGKHHVSLPPLRLSSSAQHIRHSVDQTRDASHQAYEDVPLLGSLSVFIFMKERKKSTVNNPQVNRFSRQEKYHLPSSKKSSVFYFSLKKDLFVMYFPFFFFNCIFCVSILPLL